ncbi:MAG: DUF58 domain-containing protein [Clostridia bacterium]|nr:DUF58 domain-containing protein [Clostridia bacterium]
MDLLLIALVFLLLAAAQAVLIARFGLRGFAYRRAFSRPSATAGDTVEFVEVIRNRGPLFLPWVRLESRVPPTFEFHTKEEVDIRGNNYHKSVFTLAPFSQVTRRHRVLLKKRGHFCLTQASMTAGDLLGMRLLNRDMDAPAEIFVYPALVSWDDASLPSSRAQGEVGVPRWIQPDSFLVNGIRGYQPGDPEKEIHWAATARTGELQVKTHDFTADPRLMVLINGQKSEDQWGNLMDYEQDRIEYAISLAATMCLSALNQGMEAGFAANMPLDEEEESACLLPGRGAGQEEALLRGFARLRIQQSRTFPTFLEQLPRLTGADVVILSCYDSDSIRAQMRVIRGLGNSVSLRILPEVPHA